MLLAGCYTQGGEESIAFYDIGLGGRPPTPEDIQTSYFVMADWIDLEVVEAVTPERAAPATSPWAMTTQVSTAESFSILGASSSTFLANCHEN